jgi:lysophospholipid acyltransferase (LPLAT)-like uncharacterized protein
VKFLKPYLLKAAPWAAFIFYKILSATWRISIHEPPELRDALTNGRTSVYAHWHGDELALVLLLKPYRACAMASTSSDGEIMNKVIHLMGSTTSRGSSTRGGVSAIRGILKLARVGWNPSVAVDGPRGPRHKVKGGVFEISKLLNAPIYALTATCDRAWHFEKSWNKAFLPKPFSRVSIVFGPGLPAVGRDDDAHDVALASRLEIALLDAQQHARRLLAAT